MSLLYRVIHYPFKNNAPTNSSILLRISCIWVISIVSVFPYAHTMTFDKNADFQCQAKWSIKDDFKYFLIFYICVIFAPTIIIAFFNKRCYIRLKEGRARLRTLSDPDSQGRQVCQDKRRNRLFIVIVSVFTLLTTPYWV